MEPTVTPDPLVADARNVLDSIPADPELAAMSAPDLLRLIVRLQLAGWSLNVAYRELASVVDPGDLDVTEDLEAYCAGCGHWIGHFFGMEGWQHFRGDPGNGGKRQLYDAGHAAAPAWCEPPGRFISPADLVTLGEALADAGRYRRDRAEAWCADCENRPEGACPDHLDDLDQADAYRDLAAVLERIADGQP